MTNLSKELCKICGIEPKCVNCGRTVSEDNPCPESCSEKKYPDFEQPENFVKLFKIITTIADYRFRTGRYYISDIPTYKQLSDLSTDFDIYDSQNSDPIGAFITCVIKCVIKEKDTADYIKRTEWIYE